jgi:hypothetical protein
MFSVLAKPTLENVNSAEPGLFGPQTAREQAAAPESDPASVGDAPFASESPQNGHDRQPALVLGNPVKRSQARSGDGF